MYKPSAIPSSIGFYLLLLFSFSVSVFPRISYLLAAAASVVWLMELVIFRQTDLTSSSLFYPIAGLTAVSIIVWILSKIVSHGNMSLCAGLYSMFYFVGFSFVPSLERRKMIIWTFISGVILSLAISVLSAIDSSGRPDWAAVTFPRHVRFLVLLGFGLILGYYSEARGFREKVFFGLIFIPAAIGISAVNSAMIPVLLLLLLILGIVKDRMILLAVGVVAAIIATGLFGIRQEIRSIMGTSTALQFAAGPIDRIGQEAGELGEVGFFGMVGKEAGDESPAPQNEPFFISLIKNSGPPVFLIYLWVLYELGRRDLVKIRKLALREEKAYHFATLLIIIMVVITNVYGASLSCSPAVLGLWMFMGMAEV